MANESKLVFSSFSVVAQKAAQILLENPDQESAKVSGIAGFVVVRVGDKRVGEKPIYTFLHDEQEFMVVGRAE